MGPSPVPIDLIRAVDAAIGSGSYRALTLLDRLAHADCPCRRCAEETARLSRALDVEMARRYGPADPSTP